MLSEEVAFLTLYFTDNIVTEFLACHIRDCRSKIFPSTGKKSIQHKTSQDAFRKLNRFRWHDMCLRHKIKLHLGLLPSWCHLSMHLKERRSPNWIVYTATPYYSPTRPTIVAPRAALESGYRLGAARSRQGSNQDSSQPHRAHRGALGEKGTLSTMLRVALKMAWLQRPEAQSHKPETGRLPDGRPRRCFTKMALFRWNVHCLQAVSDKVKLPFDARPQATNRSLPWTAVPKDSHNQSIALKLKCVFFCNLT